MDVNYDNKTFTTTLSSEAPIEDYVLQLVANGDVFSTKINFTVGPFATSDGSNWTGHTSGTLDMTLNDDMTATISGKGNYVAENLVIPEYVFGNGKFYKVTSIGEYAFTACSGLIGSLYIPNSVTTIGRSAFGNCSGLTGSLTIPNSVTRIDEYAFYDCSGLTGLTIGRNVNYIGGGAFQDCNGLTGSLIIPDSVTHIGNVAFSSCSGLTGLTIGSGVNSIGYGAFSKCNFDNINIDDMNQTYGLATNVGAAKIVVEKEIIGGEVECLKDYDSDDIAGCLAIGQLTILDGVNSIGGGAFNGCSGLTGLTIGSGVESIGNDAFHDCNGLTGSLTIPNSVATIGAYAFYSCSGLTGLTIGSGVNSIDNYAFAYCNRFTNITLNGFDENPSWSVGRGIFLLWNNDSSSTVSSLDGDLSAADALIYLKEIGLPSNWTAA